MPAKKNPTNYYTVIFTLKMTGKDDPNFEKTFKKLVEEAKTIDGFLGDEGIVDIGGTSILLSYWRDTDSLIKWQTNSAHNLARKKGKKTWFAAYEVHVGKTIREYSFDKNAKDEKGKKKK